MPIHEPYTTGSMHWSTILHHMIGNTQTFLIFPVIFPKYIDAAFVSFLLFLKNLIDFFMKKTHENKFFGG